MHFRPALFLFCLLFFASVQLVHAAASEPLPREAAGKISPEVWRKVESGELRELLVLFDSTAVDSELKSHLARRKLPVEDVAALALRAERYRQIKQIVHSTLRDGDASVRRDYTHLPMRLVRFADPEALLRLLQRPEVSAVLENTRTYLHLAESLPLVGQPSVASVMGRTGAGYTVAVLDTGLTYTRAEFGACTAPGVPSSCKVVAAFDAATDDGTLDAHGHGTWVAGTVAGIAPGAKIAAIDVFDGNSASSADILEGINWAIANRTTYNIVAINLSLGDGIKYTSQCSNRLSNPYRQPIINARNAGILTIASSGNDGYIDGFSSPACTPEAVSVGAVYDANVGSLTWSACTDSTTTADKVACFSNSASFLSLLAPGAMITVTGSSVGGTSFSAPMVAGAIAVMAEAFPADLPTTRLSRLTGNGTTVTDSRNSIFTPRLNLLAAQGAPGNDAFASASVLNGVSGQIGGWNLNASKESGEPNHAGNSGGKSVWWQWTAPAAGTLSLNTHASGIDTLLGVYTGGSVAALTEVAANDNDGAAGNTSSVSLAVESGVSYRIAVDGKAAASGAITLNWSLLQAQSIDFAAIGTQPVSSSLPLTATASSGLPVSFSSLTPAICTLSGNALSLIASGECSIVASQSGDANYAAAPSVTRSFSVSKLAQSITDFPVIADRALNTAPFSVTASASSGLPVAIVSLTETVCMLNGGQVTLLAVGVCSLQASQAGDAIYQAAVVEVRSFVISTPVVVGDDGDVPLPWWSTLLLGMGMLIAMLKRGQPTI